MKPLFHPQLVNDPFGDPALYVELLFEHRALLFDLGDIRALPPRKLLRVSHVFVSHAHMDHFIGFDHLLRICVGRDKQLRLYGPAGFLAQVEHRLAGYTWNLVENYSDELVLEVYEVLSATRGRCARFRCRSAFRREAEREVHLNDGAVLEENGLSVHCALLDHRTPSLAFRVQEHEHINIWKTRLEALALPTGPWLRELKEAVREGLPDTTPIAVPEPGGGRIRPLGELRDQVVQVVPGGALAYVTDCLFSPLNATRILRLARSVEWLFIEAPFLMRDGEHARRTCHLTAAQAGWLARHAGARRVTPFHFSPKYQAEPEALEAELAAALRGHFPRGGGCPARPPA